MSKQRDDAGGLVVRSDPSLRPIEKETTFGLLGGGMAWDVESYHPTAVRGLLAQPEFQVTEKLIRVVGGVEVIVGVRGQLPLGSVKIGRPRRDCHLSRVFARRGGRRELPAVRSADTLSTMQGDPS